jgi:hypothetical protein
MNKANLLIGADQQEDDTIPYELSTREKYDEFVAKRNYQYTIEFPSEEENATKD